MIDIRDTESGASFAIKVHPRAKRSAISGEIGNALKVALTAPPIDGRANEECIDMFANLLDVPRSSITIAAGQNSPNKVVKVAGLNATQVKARLNV